jgi:predicted metalloendopeptidase
VKVTGDLLATVVKMQDWDAQRVFSMLRSKVNKTRWDAHSEVTDVNAFYIDDQNAVGESGDGFE